MSDTVTKTGQLPSLGHLAKRALFWFRAHFRFSDDRNHSKNTGCNTSGFLVKFGERDSVLAASRESKYL